MNTKDSPGEKEQKKEEIVQGNPNQYDYIPELNRMISEIDPTLNGYDYMDALERVRDEYWKAEAERRRKANETAPDAKMLDKLIRILTGPKS
jgi:hypothetical protein